MYSNFEKKNYQDNGTCITYRPKLHEFEIEWLHQWRTTFLVFSIKGLANIEIVSFLKIQSVSTYKKDCV
jgi:hypothetical protein